MTIEICNFAVTHVPLSCSPSEVIRNGMYNTHFEGRAAISYVNSVLHTIEDYNAYLKQEVLEFIKQLKETPIEGREELLSRKKEVVSEISKVSREQFTLYSHKFSSYVQHAELLQDWLESTKTSRVDELSELRSSRRKA